MFVSLVNSAQVHCSREKSTFTVEKKKMRRRKRGIQTAPILATISAVPRAYKLEQIRTDFLQTCLQQLLQIGTGVKHLLTLMLTALGRVFSSGLVWEEEIKWNEKNNFRIFYSSFVWEF